MMPETKFTSEMRQALKDDLLDLAEDLICEGNDYGEVVIRAIRYIRHLEKKEAKS
jgi:hypothetical protein